jgi:tetratricopeptide (TPR) repeat protein
MTRLFSLTALLLTVGCGNFMTKLAVGTTVPAIKKASENFAMESDVELARAAAPGQLKTADGFLATIPDNRMLLEVVAQGYIEFAFGFLEDDYESMADGPARDAVGVRATGLYDRALTFALRLLATDDKNFEAAFKKDVTATETEAKKLDHDSVMGLLFAGIALGSSININRHDVARVVDLPKAIALVKRAHELDPKVYNAGAAMTLGLVYASQGKAMGGDPEASKRYFDEALATTGGRYLMIKVLMAKTYAVVIQDRALFESLLKEVLNTPASVFPEQRLANELAQRRAKRYLAHVEDYF